MSEPENSPPPNSLRARTRRQQQRRRRVRWLLLGLAGLALVLACGWFWASGAPSGTPHTLTFTIARGTSTPAIGRLLEQKGVIRSAYAFLLKTKLDGAGRELKAGRYTLSDDMTLQQVIDALAKGPHRSDEVEGIRVTIPEGYTLHQIADLLERKGVTNGTELRRLATDAQTIAGIHTEFPLPEKTLEGYLFPDTYTFKPHSPAQKILETLLANFGTRFARPYSQEIGAGRHSLHEIVTIASLIEREAEIPADRARIAGVIENRLQRHMRLEIDATVLYALGHHKTHVLYKDLKVDSPYNTYRHAGLPPGPIANAGLPCLQAALHPENHNYVYYVARPTGAHIFTRTPAEHAAAVRQVRQERKQRTTETERP